MFTWPGTPKLGLQKAFIGTYFVSKFQLCMSSGLWGIGKLIDFQAKNCSFFMFFFVSQFTIMWPTIPKIGTYDTFSSCYVESKFQLSRFYCLLVIKQINPCMPNFAKKNNCTAQCACLQSPNNIVINSKFVAYPQILINNIRYMLNIR